MSRIIRSTHPGVLGVVFEGRRAFFAERSPSASGCRCATVDLPEGDWTSDTWQQDAAAAVRSRLVAADCRARTAVISLTASQIHCQHVRLRNGSVESRVREVQHRIASELGVPHDSLYAGYSAPVGSSKPDTRDIDVLATAVSRDLVDRFCGILQRAGLLTRIVESWADSVARQVIRIDPPPRTVVWLRMGPHISYGLRLYDGVPTALRVVSHGLASRHDTSEPAISDPATMIALVKTLTAAAGPGASDCGAEGYLLSPDTDGRITAWLSNSTGFEFRSPVPLVDRSLPDAVDHEHAAHVAEFTIAALAAQATERTARTPSNLMLSGGVRPRIKVDARLVRHWPVAAACLLLALVVCVGQSRVNAMNTTLKGLREGLSQAHTVRASASRHDAATDIEYAQQPVPTSAVLALVIGTIPESIELEELTLVLPVPAANGAASNILTITAKGSELSPLAIAELSERVQGVTEFQDVHCRQLGGRSSRTAQREFTLALTMPLDRAASGTEVTP